MIIAAKNTTATNDNYNNNDDATLTSNVSHSSQKPPRPLADLNLIDDFLFHEVLTYKDIGEKFARLLLTTFLGKPVRNVKVIPQKSIPGIDTTSHGIRLDAYIEAVPDEPVPGQSMYDVTVRPSIYDIEPNRTYEKSSLPRRMRYYHSLIDARILSSSADYQDLQNVTIFTILPYDPFDRNRMVYTIQSHCQEDGTIPYDDGVTKIFFYTKGTEGNPGQELRDMLKYIEESTVNNITNQTIDEINQLVSTVKQSREVGIAYMKSWEREQMIRKEATEEGLRIGIEQGTKLGIEQGTKLGIEQGTKLGIRQGVEQSVDAFIRFCQSLSLPRTEASAGLTQQFGLSSEQASEYLNQFWPV